MFPAISAKGLRNTSHHIDNIKEIITFLVITMLVDGLAPLHAMAIADTVIQWNLSVTTTSIIKFITCDLFSNVF